MRRKNNRDHAQRKQRPMMEDQEIGSQLEALKSWSFFTLINLRNIYANYMTILTGHQWTLVKGGKIY